ncbi:MAG: glycosyltransferase, partial [Caldimonas sp.]
LEAGSAFLDDHAEVAVVCGRNRERFPDRSIYNRLADMEWDTPVGETRACGGNAMMRSAAFEQTGGFREDLIAGEEPELCVRLRALGWQVWRLEAEMTLHDSAMTHFSQWWRRSTRAGYAFAEGAHLHGSSAERHWVRETRSAQFWGAAVPMLILAGVFAFGPVAAWALLVYPLQVLRLTLKGSGRFALRALRALFLVLGKFPEALGQLKFLALHASGRRARLIEYK